MTLSAADAATHATENPFLHPIVGDQRMLLTLLLLAALAIVFLVGFKEAIELATAVCVPYLILNAVVLVRMLYVAAAQPHLLRHWQNALTVHGDWSHVALVATLLFPRLALGLSGFETGVSVMPLIRGNADDENQPQPEGRIRNTRKLLTTAAVIMSVMLLLSSFVTTLLIPPEAYREGGPASGRAIAYLAHQYLGNAFGSVYDFSTILILWFAGASAMAGLLHLIPRYLPRVGMAPQWVAYARPLVLVLFAADVIITLIFRANVDAQGGAYATGVLVLMSSAAVAAAISLIRERRFPLGLYCSAVVIVFAYTTLANIYERRDGIIIASFFIFFIMTVSGISRYARATELRVEGYYFCDAESEALWNELITKKVNMIPVRSFQPGVLKSRAQKVKKHYQIEGPMAFIHVQLLDNRSEFLSPIEIKVRMDEGRYLIEASQAVAIANAIAFLSELIRPSGMFMGLSRQNLMRQSMRYFLLGEGEAGLMVYTILQHYWEKHAHKSRPCIFLMSD
jgi:hypothetical protein